MSRGRRQACGKAVGSRARGTNSGLGAYQPAPGGGRRNPQFRPARMCRWVRGQVGWCLRPGESAAMPPRALPAEHTWGGGAGEWPHAGPGAASVSRCRRPPGARAQGTGPVSRHLRRAPRPGDSGTYCRRRHAPPGPSLFRRRRGTRRGPGPAPGGSEPTAAAIATMTEYPLRMDAQPRKPPAGVRETRAAAA